jgi:hypothetical protein
MDAKNYLLLPQWKLVSLAKDTSSSQAVTSKKNSYNTLQTSASAALELHNVLQANGIPRYLTQFMEVRSIFRIALTCKPIYYTFQSTSFPFPMSISNYLRLRSLKLKSVARVIKVIFNERANQFYRPAPKLMST